MQVISTKITLTFIETEMQLHMYISTYLCVYSVQQ